ncbi:MAG: LPS export ABC transporter permease LptF [Dissulfurimicrobium sp.]|uniref:LPS export ABC transporter permease LptF n=1 Tax=Dissulfurimicrobium sp. TaxID=2022436 RepID=UPI00404A38B0
MSILSRMLLKEIFLPFIFAFCALNALFLTGRLLPLFEPILRAGTGFKDILKLLALILPTFWVFVLPMATVVGVLLAFLRLSRDSEVLALFACGVTPRKLLIPVFLVAFTALLLSLFISIYILPKSNMAAKTFIMQLTQLTLAKGIPEHTFFTPIHGLTIYAHKGTDGGKRLKGIFIWDSRNKDSVSQIFAKNGEILTEPGKKEVTMRLVNGTLNITSQDYKNTDTINFNTYTIRLRLTEDVYKPSRGDMRIDKLWKETTDPKNTKDDKILYLVELYKRLTLPLGTLILGLLAAPLGIFFGRTGLSGGVALSLAAFLTYYTLMIYMANLAEAGITPPFLSLFMPNFAFLCITAAMLWLLNKRGPVKG